MLRSHESCSLSSPRPPQRPTLTLPRSNNAQPNIFVRQCWSRNNGRLSRFWRLTLPYSHSSNRRQQHPLLPINIIPFPPTRPQRRRVVRRPLSHLSTYLTTKPNPQRPSPSISPTTAKSFLPASNVPHATSRSHVSGPSQTTPPAR
jgi:hypothetical protein